MVLSLSSFTNSKSLVFRPDIIVNKKTHTEKSQNVWYRVLVGSFEHPMSECTCSGFKHLSCLAPKYCSTLFRESLQNGCRFCVQWWIKTVGRNVNAQLFGTTPLHLALKERNIPVVRQLLQYKASVNAIDKAGRTPLWIVSSYLYVQDAHLVKVLLDYGAKCVNIATTHTERKVIVWATGRVRCQSAAVVFMGIRCKLNSFRDTHQTIGEIIWSTRFNYEWQTGL